MTTIVSFKKDTNISLCGQYAIDFRRDMTSWLLVDDLEVDVETLVKPSRSKTIPNQDDISVYNPNTLRIVRKRIHMMVKSSGAAPVCRVQTLEKERASKQTVKDKPVTLT